jgi:hypothetical protein
MTVFVAVELFQGVVNDVQVFSTQESAEKTEREWLKEHDINDDASRECKAQNGTEFIVRECNLKP